MNTKVKKGIFWGVIVAATVLVINLHHFLLGGTSAFARGPGGHGGMGGRGGFPWLFLIIGLAIVVLLVKWLKKKSKTSSMQQFIDTSLIGSHYTGN